MDSEESRDQATPAAESATLRDMPWRWTDLLIGLAPVPLIYWGQPLLTYGPHMLWIPATFLVFAWMLVYPLRKVRPVLPQPRAVLVEGLWAVLALPVIWMVAGVVSILAQPLGELPGHPLRAALRTPDRFGLLALVVFATTLGPLAEEVFFRGMLYNALRRRIYRVPAAVVQGVLFGVLHPFGRVQQVVLSAIGVCFVGLYEWRKTLVAPVLLHVLVNVVGIAIVFSQGPFPVFGVFGTSQKDGYLITKIEKGTTAEECGLRAGDVLVAVNGEQVASPSHLVRLIRAKKVGDRLVVEYLRGGQSHYVEAILKEWRE